MKGTVLLFICFLLPNLIHASAGLVSGLVLDSSNDEVLPIATITIGNYGVLTDENGRFSVEIQGLVSSDTLTIRFLGYEVLKRSVLELKNNDTCFLTASSLALQEVVVRPINAKDILRIAYDSFFVNHVHEDISTRGFYREQFFEDEHCVRFGEAVFDTYVEEKNGEKQANLRPYLARSIEDSVFLYRFNNVFNAKRYLIPMGMDEYFSAESDDEGESIQKNHESIGEILFGKKMGFEFSYLLSEDVLVANRKNYVINFKVYKKKNLVSEGQFLIDQSTYGLTAFEVKFNEQENLTNMLIPLRFRIIMRVFGFQAEIKGYEAKIYNRFENRKWFLNNGYQILYGGIAKQKEWFRGKVMHEFYAFHNQPISQDKNERFEDIRTNNFNPHFWKDFPFSPLQEHHKENIAQIIASNRQFEGRVISKRVYEKYQEKKLKKNRSR